MSKSNEAIAIEPLIDAVQDSLLRLQRVYEKRGDLYGAMLDLQIVMDDLSDGIDRNEDQS